LIGERSFALEFLDPGILCSSRTRFPRPSPLTDESAICAGPADCPRKQRIGRDADSPEETDVPDDAPELAHSAYNHTGFAFTDRNAILGPVQTSNLIENPASAYQVVMSKRMLNASVLKSVQRRNTRIIHGSSSVVVSLG
jgi:hypothetical protein